MDSTYIGRSAGAAGIAALHQSETASRQATSIEVAHATLEEARQLAFRVFDVVERLCGCQPEPTADPSKGGISASILGNLRDDAERTAEALRAAHQRLNRLNQEL